VRIEISHNKVFLKLTKKKLEIHPLWLRERARLNNLHDKNTDQRLYDPSELKTNLKIKKASISNGHLSINFNDGIKFDYEIKELFYELNKNLPYEKPILWNSKTKSKPEASYREHMFDTINMYDLLQNFYKYGFIIIKKTPAEEDFLVKFANSIGTVRPTNFGTTFNVRSEKNYNDLAYTDQHIAAHTDNPYRKPIPCIQLLHCIYNEVEGGFSTVVDGFAVAEYLKKKHKDLFSILSSTKVRFRFVDENVILENWGKIIELDENEELKQIRHSPRLDYVPFLEKNKLEKFYKARRLFSKLCASEKFELKFKLEKGDIMMFDNHRTLHGRTSFNKNEGKRFLKGCYIDHDSTEGKLRFLERKFNLKWKK
tara:strand:+ start:1576 stop:2682 length:1107 start_codon:yes stop_codon:yes gene_type:complete